PLLVGRLHPQIVLPRLYEGEEARTIFTHELTHWSHNDIAAKLLLAVVCALHWYNPAVWLLRREWNRDMEWDCDEAVLQNATLPQRRAYGEIILRAAAGQGRRQTSLTTCLAEGKLSLKQRLANLFDSRKKRWGAAVSLTAWLVALVGIFSVTCTAAGIPLDTPSAVRAWAEHRVAEGVQDWESKNEWDGAVLLDSKVSIVDSSITGLTRLACAKAPDGSGAVELWHLRYRLKLAHPQYVAGGLSSFQSNGWVRLDREVSRYFQPLWVVWRDRDGTYTELREVTYGELGDPLWRGGEELYASEALYAHRGVRSETVGMPFVEEKGVKEDIFGLYTGDENSAHPFSLYVPNGWIRLPARPMDTPTGESWQRIGGCEDPQDSSAQILLYHYDKLSVGTEIGSARNDAALETILENAAEDCNAGPPIQYPGKGTMTLFSGQKVDTKLMRAAGDREFVAFAIPDTTGGCYGVVVRGFGDLSVPDTRLWAAARTVRCG
ncbi:MAG: M56 family metallopeptidase, partial [Oscillospiraceae bacterium]